MSRLTSSLFHKPSPFDPSLLLPSPPDSSITLNPVQDIGFTNANPESPGTRLRKSSSIHYHSSSLRDSKEKGQRSGKALIIVIPPPTLVYDHFTSTLSNGPFHRLSEGVAMPLFPSMITQLAAIAREFNFPSTSGLCLYFHHIEEGLTLKPRISEDSWPSIWSYLSDLSGPSERRPLISGKVEFDIDLRLARWYAPWLSSIHRELSECHGHIFTSTAPSLTHARGESQVSLPEGRPFDVNIAEHSFTQRPEHNRHVPRKLSLAERFDLVPVRPDLKPSSRSALSPPDVRSAGSQVLSTIVQEDEPKTSREILDTRVKSWRESALSIPSPLAATGQTSLDPVNLPNDMPIESLPTSAGLKLEAFTWSISSAGPGSCDNPSSVSEVYVPSVHLASRIAGTVCSTPSVCTSFGPDSSGIISPTSLGHAPSVHIASRLAGSVCTSPSVCTSFGPDDDTSFFSFLDIYRVSTPDIAHRLFESVPSTPQTATTWGAPLSYPPSPRCLSPSPSLDLGERSMSGEFEMPLPSFLCYGPSDTAGWSLVTSHGIGNIRSTSSYPYFNIYNPTYPYLEIYPAIPGAMNINSQSTLIPSSNPALDSIVEIKIPPVYPSFDIYPAVYPFNLQRIYPSIPNNIFQDAPDPVTDSPLEIKVELKIPCVYPSFYLYPAVYPFNLEEIYAAVKQSYPVELSEGHYPPLSPPFYARLALHHPLSPYPEFQIYHDIPALSCPIVPSETADIPQSIHLRKYPIFNIYPAVYPFFDLYPAIEECERPTYDFDCPELSLSTTVESVYPFFNLFPPVYPHLEIYPVHPALAYQPLLKQDQIDEEARRTLSTSIETRYPTFNLYKAVYPHFDIYPIHYASGWSQDNLEQGKEKSVTADSTFSRDFGQPSRLTYPFFNLYPALYPHFDLYPAPGGAIVLSQPKLLQSSCIVSKTLYPIFNLYPAVYPYFDLYLPLPESKIQPPFMLKKREAKSSTRLTHSELEVMVMEDTTKSGDGHLGLEVHRHSVILQSPRSLPREKFGGRNGSFLQNVGRQTEPLPQWNNCEPDSSRSPGKRDSVVWQRIKAFDSNGST